jgi:hypothetical protein
MDIQLLVDMAIGGLVVGVFAAVVFGAVRLGWKFAPWIVGVALLLYLIQ